MPKRTTIEIDENLLARAKRALAQPTARATVEEALKRAADAAEGQMRQRAEAQVRYLDSLKENLDLDVLASHEMWR